MAGFFSNVLYAVDFRRRGQDIALHNVQIDRSVRELLTARDLVAIDEFFEGSGTERPAYRIESTD